MKYQKQKKRTNEKKKDKKRRSVALVPGGSQHAPGVVYKRLPGVF